MVTVQDVTLYYLENGVSLKNNLEEDNMGLFGKKKKEEVRTFVKGQEQREERVTINPEVKKNNDVETSVNEFMEWQRKKSELKNKSVPVVLAMEPGTIYFLDSSGNICFSKIN